MWFTTSSSSDGSFLKSSFKTKIKRGKIALTRQNSSSSLFSSSEEKSTKKQKADRTSDVSAEWEFVSFNPNSFTNRRNSIAECTSKSASSGNLLGDLGGVPVNGTLVEEEVYDFLRPLPEVPPLVIKRRCSTPNMTPPNSRPPSWLAAFPHHFLFEDVEGKIFSLFSWITSGIRVIGFLQIIRYKF